jgi:hypothetical protein
LFQSPVIHQRQLREKQLNVVTVGINLENVDPVLDHVIDVLVKKFERADAQGEQRQTFQEFEGGDETQTTGRISSLSHFSRPRFYIKKQAQA